MILVESVLRVSGGQIPARVVENVGHLVMFRGCVHKPENLVVSTSCVLLNKLTIMRTILRTYRDD